MVGISTGLLLQEKREYVSHGRFVVIRERTTFSKCNLHAQNQAGIAEAYGGKNRLPKCV